MQSFSTGLLLVRTLPVFLESEAYTPTIADVSLSSSAIIIFPTAAYIFALSVYLTVGLPASRTIATPIEGVDTREDQIEALRLLSAGNTIIIALLGGVLALQVR